METILKIILAVNVLFIAFCIMRLLLTPLKFEETKPNYNTEVDRLLSLDETEIKISEWD